jgi:hypothetical protein
MLSSNASIRIGVIISEAFITQRIISYDAK